MDEIFDTTTSFQELGLSPPLLRAIESLGFEHPTCVQSSLIPVALSGRDVLAQSKTGTGKTAAFGIPIIEMLSDPGPFEALVLCPTRELAIQVCKDINTLAANTNLKIEPIYGGQKIPIQASRLEKKPHVIVGTPGRVMDFHQRGLLPYKNMRITILDEVDRMLDIGFRDDIKRILGTMKQDHQTIFVSATISDEIERLARKFMHDPEKLTLESPSLTVSQVDQLLFHVAPWDKRRLLLHLMNTQRPDMAIVFCRTKRTVDTIASFLSRNDIHAKAIHGDLHQGQRNRIMTLLRNGDLHILVASDLAARGLDIQNISHVINYDLPEDPDIYVHRIGRTARVGRRGIAWTFVTPDQGAMLSDVEKLTNAEIHEGSMKGFEPGPVPAHIARDKRDDSQRREALSVKHSRTVNTPPPPDDDIDTGKFPDGAVPISMPEKRMRGRLKTRRR